ncbi:hypothetical protein [Rhodococcus sp. RS1C4]|nr:hypothetical protein [Rhodococcus sp. RS1C4]
MTYRPRPSWLNRWRDIAYPRTLKWRLLTNGGYWTLHIPVPFAGTIRIGTPLEVR